MLPSHPTPFRKITILAFSLPFTSNYCPARIHSCSLFSTLKRHVKYPFLISPVYLAYILLHIQKVSLAHYNVIIWTVSSKSLCSFREAARNHFGPWQRRKFQEKGFSDPAIWQHTKIITAPDYNPPNWHAEKPLLGSQHCLKHMPVLRDMPLIATHRMRLYSTTVVSHST